jgi:hypothetical protein
MQVLTNTKFETVAFQWPAGFYSDGIHIGLRRHKKDLAGCSQKYLPVQLGLIRRISFKPHQLS